jgi:amidase
MPSLSARDARDPLWNAAPDSGRAHGARLRIGYATDPFGDGVHPGVAKAVEIAVAAARAVGHDLVEVALPMAHEAAETWGQLLNAEAEVSLGKAIREHGSPEVQGVIFGFSEMFGVPDLEGFIAAQARRLTIQRAWAQMFEGIDALILPVSSQPPFRADQDIVEPDTLPEILRAQRPMFILNLLGLPAAVVRTGPVEGVPLGVQIAGAWRDDDLCLDLAWAIESELALDLRPVDPA